MADVSNAPNLADWLGAIGSAGAAIVAVAIYAIDVTFRRLEERRRRERSRRSQALHLSTLLEGVSERLFHLLGVQEEQGPPPTDYLPAELEILGVEEMQAALIDPSVLDQKDVQDLYLVISKARLINQHIRAGAAATGRVTTNALPRFPALKLSEVAEVSVELRVRMWSTAIAKPYFTSSEEPGPLRF